MATLMWNQTAHMEAYFGVPSAGGVLHTLNLRLHPDEISFIANHAGDRFLIVDDVLLPVYEKFRDRVKFERVIVVPFGGGATPAGCDDYEELLAGASEDFTYPQLDENEAAAMCYTSGTTGRSKGVVYSHRAIALHSMSCCGVDSLGISMRDTILPVTSLFHANGWGIPFTAAMAGAKVVLAGPLRGWRGPSRLDGAGARHGDDRRADDLVRSARSPREISRPMEIYPGRCECIVGGAATSEALMRGFDRHGITVICSWGMTETTPVATSCHLRPHMDAWSEEKKYAQRTETGHPGRISSKRASCSPTALWRRMTDASIGEIEVRGPWVAASYYNMPEEAQKWSPDGWLRTGDMGHIDEYGYMKLVDRSKDLIKSGGEWISSVDLENALMGHPAVKEAAVIGVPHPKWQERPLAVVVLNEGAKADPAELREFLGGEIREVAIAGRVRVRQGNSAHVGGQIPQDGAARAVCRLDLVGQASSLSLFRRSTTNETRQAGSLSYYRSDSWR